MPTEKALNPSVSRPITGKTLAKGKPNALTMTVIDKTPTTIGSLRAYRQPSTRLANTFGGGPAGRAW